VHTLGRIPDTLTFRPTSIYPAAVLQRGVLVVKIDSRIYFASVDPIKSSIMQKVRDNTAAGDPPRFLVMDVAAVSDIDATGVQWMGALLEGLRLDHGISVVLANPTRSFLLNLKRAGLERKLGAEAIHVNLRSAVEWAQREVARADVAEAEAARRGDGPTTAAGAGKKSA
jgi:MFS superfamily sulfate permease-like transporter